LTGGFNQASWKALPRARSHFEGERASSSYCVGAAEVTRYRFRKDLSIGKIAIGNK